LYRPVSAEEEKIFKSARRDIFPNDVRAQLDQSRDQMIAWTGIVKRIDVKSDGDQISANILFEHHYWDWIEDFGTQVQRAFLSPRGEGLFQCAIASGETKSFSEKEGDLAIVYGTPERVADGGTVLLRCYGVRSFGRSYYATDVWDYGRDFLLKGDKADFKILRTPIFR